MQVRRSFIVLPSIAFSVAAALTLAAGAAAAHTAFGEAQPDYPQAFSSSLSRATVRAEAVAAVAQGQVLRGEANEIVAPTFVATKSRAEVRAEAAAAVRLGLVARGELAPREATAAELEVIRMAGAQARMQAELMAAK